MLKLHLTLWHGFHPAHLEKKKQENLPNLNECGYSNGWQIMKSTQTLLSVWTAQYSKYCHDYSTHGYWFCIISRMLPTKSS